MAKFYFTYGTEGQPFVGGWTEVEAPDRRVACDVFRAIHPDKTEGLLNCSSVYSEEQFSKTGMASRKGNFGSFCHEKISVAVTTKKELAMLKAELMGLPKSFYEGLLEALQQGENPDK